MTAAERKLLKAPFPAFGGKSRVAALVWRRIGDVENWIEPFCFSAAVTLKRPHPPRIETVNDADSMIANFWRATQRAPELVAEYADGPVNEVDLHARHKFLVLSKTARRFRRKMRTNPSYFNPQFAGWWCWGLCCWIGGGWCAGKSERENPTEWKQVPDLSSNPTNGGKGIHAAALSPGRKPRIDGGEGQYGHGVHAKGVREKMPGMIGGHDARGINGQHRPQLADAYDVGRGVNSNGDLGTCAARRAWLVDWFGRLRDRLRLVRVCCGDWLRVCGSESVTTRLGTTGIFFDPPYSTEAGRDMNLYAVECGKVAHAVRAYCLERGGDPRYRIALCGYAGEGHEELEQHGWEAVAWTAQGGYGNRSAKGKANASRERIFFSPHCLRGGGLFDGLDQHSNF